MLDWNRYISSANSAEFEQKIQPYAMRKGNHATAFSPVGKIYYNLKSTSSDEDDNGSTSNSSSGRGKTGVNYSLHHIKQITKFFHGNLKKHALFKARKQPIKTKKTDRRKLAEQRNKDMKQQVKRIIKAAERKVSDKKLSKYERKLATNFFNGHYEKAKNFKEIAMIALLGVINAYITGGIRPVVQVNWGNQLNIPKIGPNINNPLSGPSTLDQINHYNAASDPLGLEANAVINTMYLSGFFEDFIRFLKTNGYYYDPVSNTIFTTQTNIVQLAVPSHSMHSFHTENHTHQ